MKASFLSLILMVLIQHLWAQNNPNPEYLFILDASGSMWQKLDNEFKIAVAKTVMKDLVQKLPSTARAGMVAYGHRSKTDCADIETLIPLAPLDKTTFVSKLNAINPQGRTPIAKSIQHTLALLSKESQPVTIILVSDGLETCEGNACELVKQAKKNGAKITVHVVGFGIEEQNISALECIAQAGGGQYLPANNAADLIKALDKTIEAPVLNGGYLSVKVTLEGKPVDATVKVFKSGESKESVVGRTYTGPETNPRVLLLPAGTYRAEVAAITLDGRPVQLLENLSISQNDTVRKDLDFARGSVDILVTRNGALSDAVVRLYKAGTREVVTQTRSYTNAKSNPVKFAVLPGTYDVEISSVEIEGKPLIRIEKQILGLGSSLSLAQHYKSGELLVGARQGSTLIDATIGIYNKKNGQNIASGRTFQTASSNPKTFILEPGEYEVRFSPIKPTGLSKKNMNITIPEKGKASLTGEW